MKLCVVFVLVAVLRATDGKRPCCVPDQWEAVVSGENATTSHGRGEVTGFVEPRLSLDFKANKIAVQELIYTASKQQNLTVIVDYNVRFMWVIEWFPGHAHCVKTALPAATKPQKCIPPDWTYTATLRMGFGSNVVSTDNFVSPQPSSFFGSILVTSDTCVPLTEYYRVGVEDGGTILSFGIFNATPGIRDRSVFKVPSFCPSSAVKWDPETMRGQDVPELGTTTKYLIKRFTTFA